MLLAGLVVGLVLIAAVGIGWYVLEQPKQPDFWRLAARHPDNAYDWFVSHEGWVVIDPGAGRVKKPKGPGYTGPFILWVPKLGGKRVLVYGEAGRVEESQEAFIRVFRQYGE
jgi:hypothetical protein